MDTRLRQALDRAEEIAQELADPTTIRNQTRLKTLGREHRRLAPVVEAAKRLDRLKDELSQARELADAADVDFVGVS